MNTAMLQCPGCGSSRVHIDLKKRKLICDQCGNEMLYSRATVNATTSDTIKNRRDNAYEYFKTGKFELAYKFAREVLTVASDYVPARYIIAFYEENKIKKAGVLKQFFGSLDGILLEYDEIIGLEQLFLAFPYKLIEYETDVLKVIMDNLEEEDERQELRKFIDGICPFWISKRPSQNYLTPELLERYRILASQCSVPKTCFALLDSIRKNPDSPYNRQEFELITRNQYYYDNYCKPIGTVLGAMGDEGLRTRFMAQYELMLSEFRKDTGVTEIIDQN